ncbi:hypothetical protein BU24DRAFT_241880 [Aaosphaeria arxii CBS 175.79]|uniref:Lytic polysaccharide monooxygenase n=1 Tax=Aaosphaeria arxii CBS 175.79 TaxID=1450172 RepID=A0A6A5XLA7_9PLEO|nr:uncharacterized protein BU24DRAFT_241880 [Aaosphaeria arxii CBS 175.79]KAF2013629.1 hypothetical protein BU24DRAFT_241880 [Aaosphaeria arxii CBS 175.79]
MKLRSYVLGVVVGACATTASAQRQVATPVVTPVFPIQNTTTATPTVTALPCENQCSVYYPQLSAISWIPTTQIIYTTKITAAIEMVIIRASGNITLPPSTELIYSIVPSEYQLYERGYNEQGTAVLTIATPLPDGEIFWTPITYPTPWMTYSTEYQWEGVLQTHDKSLSPACATAGPEASNVPLFEWPTYPIPEVKVDENDPFGYDHQPLWVPVEEQPDKKFFDQNFPSESAFSFCESMSHKPTPTKFEAAKYVTVTSTVYTEIHSVGIGHVESSATGWEEPTRPTGPDKTIDIPRVQSTVSGFEDPVSVATGNIFQSAVSNIGGQSSIRGQPPPDIITPIPAVTPTAGRPRDPSTPVFTMIPTVIADQSTTIPAFVIPGSSSIATIGQTVTLDGTPTVLTPPPTVFTSITTTINGVPTAVPVYIINGTSTANLGDTVTVSGQTTVLAAPPAVATWIPTTINGVSTSIPAYIISGTSTATIGQTVIVEGSTTVLSTPTDTQGGGSSQGGPRPTESTFEGSGSLVRASWVACIVPLLFVLLV